MPAATGLGAGAEGQFLTRAFLDPFPPMSDDACVLGREGLRCNLEGTAV